MVATTASYAILYTARGGYGKGQRPRQVNSHQSKQEMEKGERVCTDREEIRGKRRNVEDILTATLVSGKG